MIKKIVSCLAAVVLIVCQLSVASFAAEPVKLTLSGGKVYAGEELTVNLFISDNSNLSGAAIKINYDKSMLKYVSGEPGGIIDSTANVAVNNMDTSNGSYVIFTYMSPSATVTAEGILLTLKFEALPNAVGTSDLTLTIDAPGDFVDGNLSKLSYTVENSKITVINDNAVSTVPNSTETTEIASDENSSTYPSKENSTVNQNTDDENGKKSNDTVKIICMIAAGAVLIAIGTAVIITDRKKR